MKLLSHVTLALHFAAVMILIGSLLLVIGLDLLGRSKKNADQVSAAYTLAKRLPVVMTYVINLGVPPLLFAQVLYGRAIYSSSVLIGVMWISIIPLLMLAYWLLYATNSRLEKGRPAWMTALFALIVAASIGQIYSMNMTLMLRPEVWSQMYNNSPSGLQGVHGDPTMTPRYMFVMMGGLLFGGVWALLLSNMKYLTEGVQKTLRRSGGIMAVVGALVQIVMGHLVATNQPEPVRAALAGSGFHNIVVYLFLATAGLTLVVSGLQVASGKPNVLLGTVGLLTAFVAQAGAVLYRDGIRDFTLQQKGFDVWQRTEVSNWGVIALFLLLFVIMLAVIFWLLMVMRKATPPTEQVSL